MNNRLRSVVPLSSQLDLFYIETPWLIDTPIKITNMGYNTIYTLEDVHNVKNTGHPVKIIYTKDFIRGRLVTFFVINHVTPRALFRPEGLDCIAWINLTDEGIFLRLMTAADHWKWPRVTGDDVMQWYNKQKSKRRR